MENQNDVGASLLTAGLERAPVPIGYLNLWEGGYNHEESPTFTKDRQTMASLPSNYTHCWPIYDLAAVVAAVKLVRSNDGLEREKFEAWINHPKALERFSGSSAVAGFYVREDVQMQWEAWEAALRSNMQGEAQPTAATK